MIPSGVIFYISAAGIGKGLMELRHLKTKSAHIGRTRFFLDALIGELPGLSQHTHSQHVVAGMHRVGFISVLVLYGIAILDDISGAVRTDPFFD